MATINRYFFCGIGGAGMSPLARLLAARGCEVWGSDRAYDMGRNLTFFEILKSEGIKIVPQDGLGLDTSITHFVVTRAVESSVPDIKKALELKLSLVKRPQLMRDLFTATRNVMVGGTSGKSTTTGMIGYILHRSGINPTIVNGAVMLNYKSNILNGGGLNGGGETAVFESDESDGHSDVISLCHPAVAVLTNISLDHFEVDELKEIFGGYLKKASEGVVINADCLNSQDIRNNVTQRTVTFGVREAADVQPEGLPLNLKVPGEHNVANALAAIAACRFFDVPDRDSALILSEFRGIQRRLELVGEARGVRVIDDFASNPGKIAATLSALKQSSRRLIVIFQPHGFQPTKMMREGYIQTFSTLLEREDYLIMPEIYYVGGSVNIVDGREVPLPKDISSRDLIEEIHDRLPNSHFFADRRDVLPLVKDVAREGDTVVVMGSRDETLPQFASEVVEVLG